METDLKNPDLMQKIIGLAKRRGFIFPGSEIYGGLAGAWDYGPLGIELKNNIRHLWWKRFARDRDDMVGIDAAIIMNPRVWEASGHVETFTDPLVECMRCHKRFRADQKDEQKAHQQEHRKEDRKKDAKETAASDSGDATFTEPRNFNLLFRTFVGPVEDSASVAYLRPETAQAMFTNFKNVLDTTHRKLPFGIAQIGRVFRNEITPRDFIFRSREFEQMEIEYFVRESEWETHFEHWLNEMRAWIRDLGVDMDHVHEFEAPKEDRAHYSKRTVDFEYDFPFGRKELYGVAYRGDFDLQNHMKASGADLRYTDPATGDKFLPHVIEPTWGVDRTVLAVMLAAYREEENEKGTRVFLKVPPGLAPYKAAVFPLVANKEHLVARAHEIYKDLKQHMTVAWDDRGNIGKRYYAQDEIGTPACITVDYKTLEDGTVTVRDRDTAKQERVSVSEVRSYIQTTYKI